MQDNTRQEEKTDNTTQHNIRQDKQDKIQHNTKQQQETTQHNAMTSQDKPKGVRVRIAKTKKDENTPSSNNKKNLLIEI